MNRCASLFATAIFLLSAGVVRGELTQRQQEVRALVAGMAQAENIGRWWSEHPGVATRDNAAVADELGMLAAEAKQNPAASAFYLFASLAYLHAGALEESLVSMLNEHQVRYLDAEKPEEYQELRSSALSFLDKARQIKAHDAAMGFAVLAANCSYFEHENEGDDITGESVATILRDLVVALEEAKARSAETDIQNLVSLTRASVNVAMRELYPNYEELRMLLAEVAAGSEIVIPANYAFTSLPEADGNSIDAALHLAKLSQHFGNPRSANARLEWAQSRVCPGENLLTCLTLVVQQYDVVKQWLDDPAKLDLLRHCARDVTAHVRANRRSRAGRIWAAYEYDRACGEMLRDELFDEDASPERLFETVESSKARTLLDYLRTPPVELPDTAAASTERLEKIVLGFPDARYQDDSLMAAELKLVSQLSSFSDFGEEPEKRGQALAMLEELHSQARAGFAASTSPASLAEVQAALADDEAIIEYVIPYHALHPASALGIFAVTKADILGVHMDTADVLPPADNFRMSLDGAAPIDSSAIGDQVIALRVAIQDADERKAREKLRGFYELLIGPLVKHGFDPARYSRLIIVPHGMLHYVPFAALLDGNGAPLIRKTAVTVAPSAATWLMLQKRGAVISRWIGFANPKLDADDLPSLGNSEKEVAQIAGIMRPLACRVEVGADATKERFIEAADGGSILHLATHGELPDDNAIDGHGLLLSGKAGALRAKEVRRLPLSSAQLVVLSVCNGGLYRIGPADEPYGLVPAFLIAGAQNVMATLWPLEDQFGRRFTVEFYRQLMTKGPAEALRAATLHFIDEDELLRNWAAFVMIGPGRPFVGRAAN